MFIFISLDTVFLLQVSPCRGPAVFQQHCGLHWLCYFVWSSQWLHSQALSSCLLLKAAKAQRGEATCPRVVACKLQNIDSNPSRSDSLAWKAFTWIQRGWHPFLLSECPCFLRWSATLYSIKFSTHRNYKSSETYRADILKTCKGYSDVTSEVSDLSWGMECIY